MKVTHLLGVVFLIIAAITIIALQQDGTADEKYNNEIQDKRNRIKHFLKTNNGSPIPETERGTFTGPAFFPIDKKWSVEATLEPAKEKQTLNLGEAAKAPKLYKVLGNLVFELEKKPQKLQLLQAVQPPKAYFLAFHDETNSESTYGGGRYLDPKKIKHKENSWELDFNLAYHPYCFYNENFYCPLVPAGNRLSVAVEAGEKGRIAHKKP